MAWNLYISSILFLPEKCECGQFILATNFLRHRQTHSGSENQCPGCGISFVRKHKLQEHLEREICGIIACELYGFNLTKSTFIFSEKKSGDDSSESTSSISTSTVVAVEIHTPPKQAEEMTTPPNRTPEMHTSPPRFDDTSGAFIIRSINNIFSIILLFFGSYHFIHILLNTFWFFRKFCHGWSIPFGTAEESSPTQLVWMADGIAI